MIGATILAHTGACRWACVSAVMAALWTASVCLAQGEGVEALADPSGFAKAHPQLLKWPDRRPMARIFLSKVTSGWEKNPRGYLSDKNLDITTPEGRAAFGTKLMAFADRSIEVMKQNNAQGVIIWDLEGQENPHAISYIGDPRALPKIAPEMDEHADAFFKKFRDAGLVVGLCIRPTRIKYVEAGRWKWQHERLKDPVVEMDDKISYASKRWGCRIFYIDSNTCRQVDIPELGTSGPLPASMFRALAEKHPDALLIPEWETFSYFAVSAPYKCFWDGWRTPPMAGQIWPGAFSHIAVNDRELLKQWDVIVPALAAGDVLFVDGWINTSLNELVKQAYRAEELSKAGPPNEVASANAAKLAGLTKSSDVRMRYYAIGALAALDPATAGPVARTLMKDQDWLVRKAAVDAAGVARDDKAIADLIVLLNGEDNLAQPAAAALAKIGKPAAASLLELIQKGDTERLHWAATALAMMGDRDAVPALIAVQRKSRQVVDALGELGDPRAIPALAALFEGDAAGEGVRLSATEALASIGGPDAVAALEKIQASLPAPTNPPERRLTKAVAKAIEDAKKPKGAQPQEPEQ